MAAWAFFELTCVHGVTCLSRWAFILCPLLFVPKGFKICAEGRRTVAPEVSWPCRRRVVLPGFSKLYFGFEDTAVAPHQAAIVKSRTT